MKVDDHRDVSAESGHAQTLRSRLVAVTTHLYFIVARHNARELRRRSFSGWQSHVEASDHRMQMDVGRPIQGIAAHITDADFDGHRLGWCVGATTLAGSWNRLLRVKDGASGEEQDKREAELQTGTKGEAGHTTTPLFGRE